MKILYVPCKDKEEAFEDLGLPRGAGREKPWLVGYDGFFR